MKDIKELSENDLGMIVGGKATAPGYMKYTGKCACNKKFTVTELQTESVCACGNVFSLINYKVYCNNIELPETSYTSAEVI
ncbi:MAG: hypothetical protein KBS59_00120 [Clostridiales bacterium]|nr:hypothetical protein [Clostridiales bacterium]